MIGALIGAGASLLGGVMDRNATAAANKANRPENQVREWEAAGINPIFGISSGGYIRHRAASIGDAFATAGAQFQRGMEFDHKAKIAETELAQENERLRGALDRVSQPRQRTALQQTALPLSDPTQASETIEATPIEAIDNAGRPLDANGNIIPRQAVPFGGGLLTLPEETSSMQVFEDDYGEAAAMDQSFWRYVGHGGYADQKYDWYADLLDYQPTFKTDPQAAQQGRNALAVGLGAAATAAVAAPVAAHIKTRRPTAFGVPIPRDLQRTVGGRGARQAFNPFPTLF